MIDLTEVHENGKKKTWSIRPECVVAIQDGLPDYMEGKTDAQCTIYFYNTVAITMLFIEESRREVLELFARAYDRNLLNELIYLKKTGQLDIILGKL